jgi:hypothetical protein
MDNQPNTTLVFLKSLNNWLRMTDFSTGIFIIL